MIKSEKSGLLITIVIADSFYKKSVILSIKTMYGIFP